MAHQSAIYYALQNAKVKTTDNQWFIPITSIDRIVTKSAVRNGLQTSYYLASDVDPLVRKICQASDEKSQFNARGDKLKLDWLKDIDTPCRRIFAILVLIDKATSEIVKPVVEALCDLDLPLYRQGRQWLLSSRHDPSIRYWSATDMSCLHTADWAAEDRKRFF
ncbi:hypothetical protein NKR19_g4699 [Coniochaeta hoffmannii]|uniref:Uncharacterized protein n=1 Tax=Coniochaeta hoffmannii TaxID=91930 RepID=A0AA38S6S3_9PEZI|nr:hypothetical protein NKR19_g4699 [Coniochaeta hoffmannii]